MTQLERREIQPQITVGVLLTRTFDDLGEAFPEQLPRIAAQIHELGGAIAGPPYARYLEMDGQSVTLAIGVPVHAPVAGIRPMSEADEMEVAQSELPGGQVAVLTHVGPYDELRHTWARLDEVLAEEGVTPGAAAWESYVDDPDETPPDGLRTEIIVPLG